MNLDDLSRHLSHKRKTVSDLIRFIGNTADKSAENGVKTHNYSILLDAGASVSSGIRSGQTLIKEWKKQIYDEDTNNKETIRSVFPSRECS